MKTITGNLMFTSLPPTKGKTLNRTRKTMVIIVWIQPYGGSIISTLKRFKNVARYYASSKKFLAKSGGVEITRKLISTITSPCACAVFKNHMFDN
jgi:hypothetical protein